MVCKLQSAGKLKNSFWGITERLQAPALRLWLRKSAYLPVIYLFLGVVGEKPLLHFQSLVVVARIVTIVVFALTQMYMLPY